jgi:hypothetical protein
VARLSQYIIVRHRGCLGDGIAFYCDHIPAGNEAILSRYALLIDGTPPIPGHPFVCGSCGHHVGAGDLRVTNERIAMEVTE